MNGMIVLFREWMGSGVPSGLQNQYEELGASWVGSIPTHSRQYGLVCPINIDTEHFLSNVYRLFLFSIVNPLYTFSFSSWYTNKIKGVFIMAGENVIFPTNELIQEKNEEWNNVPEYIGPERALNQLFNGKSNSNHGEVFAKCYFLNFAYGTHLLKKDLYTISNYIVKASRKVQLDKLLDEGDTKAVHMIAFKSRTSKIYFSFATKFCSFCNPSKYPIYDSFVEEVLWRYKNNDILEPYYHWELSENREPEKRYQKFKSKVDELKEVCNLTCTYRELDHFLWLKQKELNIID